MASRFEARLRKLEALKGGNPMDGLEPHELKALLIVFNALIAAEQSGSSPEVTNEMLAEKRMSLDEFNKASARFTPAFCQRLDAYMAARR